MEEMSGQEMAKQTPSFLLWTEGKAQSGASLFLLQVLIIEKHKFPQRASHALYTIKPCGTFPGTTCVVWGPNKLIIYEEMSWEQEFEPFPS